jgi:hypothetical protein
MKQSQYPPTAIIALSFLAGLTTLALMLAGAHTQYVISSLFAMMSVRYLGESKLNQH